jgi:hypothetical protein
MDDIIQAIPHAAGQPAPLPVTPATQAVLKLVEGIGGTITEVARFPTSLSDEAIGIAFYDTYVKTGVAILDVPLKTRPHGMLVHMIQDLAISKILSDPRLNKTGLNVFEFRMKLGELKDVLPINGMTCTLGDHIWRALYDPFDLTVPNINQPEFLMPFLKKLVPDLE